MKHVDITLRVCDDQADERAKYNYHCMCTASHITVTTKEKLELHQDLLPWLLNRLAHNNLGLMNVMLTFPKETE